MLSANSGVRQASFSIANIAQVSTLEATDGG